MAKQLSYKKSIQFRSLTIFLCCGAISLFPINVFCQGSTDREFQILSILILFLILLVLIMLFLFYRNRLQLNQSQRKIDEVLKDQEIKTLQARLEGQDAERIRIGQDLHDRLGATLSTIKIYFKSVEEKIEDTRNLHNDQFQIVSDLLDEASNEVRIVAHDMQSRTLTNFGLKEELRELTNILTASQKIEINLETSGMEFRLDSQMEFEIYKIIQELVANTLKHSKASLLYIHLAKFDKLFNILIKDNGIGFDPKKTFDGMGLKNTQARVSYLHGEMNIDSIRGNGTTIYIDIPLDTLEGIKNISPEAAIIGSVAESNTPLHEAKLIIVGNGGVGKTTLKENLIDSNYQVNAHPSTHGIEINPWIVNVEHEGKEIEFKFNIWDFGGQGKYRAVQQLFCTQNSLYLYVTELNDKSQDEGEQYVGFPFWVNLITTFSKNQQQLSPPLIYVYNKIDADPDYLNNILNRKDEINHIQNFSSLNKFAPVSCKSGEGLENLKREIKNSLPFLSKDIFSRKYPDKWLNVKEALEENPANYIPLEAYENICLEQKVDVGTNGDSESEIWLKILDEIGTVVHFSDIPYLKNIVILKPNWLKEAAYSLLDCPMIIDHNGAFSKNDFKLIWKEHTRDEQDRLIELMKAFEICYEIQSSGKYVVPALLAADKPQNFEATFKQYFKENAGIQIRCEFKPFLPAGVFHKFLIRNNAQISEDCFWRAGGIFSEDSAHVFIEEDWKNKTIEIKGQGKHIATFLEQTIKGFQEILDESFHSKITIHPSLIYQKDVFNYSNLQERIKNNVHEVFSSTHACMIPVISLVNGLKIEVVKSGKADLEAIKKSVADNKIEQALSLLHEVILRRNPEQENEVLTLQAQAKNIKTTIRLGVSTEENINILKNQLNQGILSLVAEFE